MGAHGWMDVYGCVRWVSMPIHAGSASCCEQLPQSIDSPVKAPVRYRGGLGQQCEFTGLCPWRHTYRLAKKPFCPFGCRC